MKKFIQKYKIIMLAAVLYAVLFIVKRDIFMTAVRNTWGFLVEMIQVLPPVLVISALITVWVPSDIIKKGLGAHSGLKGRLISLFIGSVSAGPIYAAFPAVLVLFKKGASISNMVIILSSWAVVKIPMILVETGFLGIRFALARVALTIPAIFLMGFLVERFVKPEDIIIKAENPAGSPKEILSGLPNLNCKGCGFDSCRQFAEAVYNNEKVLLDCVILQKQADKKEYANV